jgi:hypothetical protein
MEYFLSYRLGGAVPNLDPDAKGYIDAVVAAGGTVSGAQRSAINTFYKTGKSDGWYSSLKRMYLPIWGAAAPNAICMTSLTSGTFVIGVTHAAGYIQGNGTTGYFDPGASGNLRTLGMSGSTLHYMVGVSQQGTAASIIVGAFDGNLANRCQLTEQTSPSGNVLSAPELISSPVNTASPRDGILIGSCTTASSRYLHRRKTAGTTVTTDATATTANVPNGQPYIMARNNLSPASVSLYYDGRIFAASYGLAIAQADAPKFSLAIKNLWETCTGLTLP